MKSVTVRVLLFAHLRDHAPEPLEADGGFSLTLPAPATVRTLAAALAETATGLQNLTERSRIAVGTHFAMPETALSDGDEIAFLPPMSGG